MRSLIVPCLLGCLSVAGQQWVQMPDFPGTARDDAATFTIGTDVYVGTGREVGWGYTSDWWAFSVVTGEWRTVAGLPADGRQYAATFSLEDKGYLFGGTNTSGPLAELWMYDPTDDTWTQRASLPASARYACASFSYDGHGYVATGITTGGSLTNEVWRYDPGTDTWEERAPFPGSPRHRASAFVSMVPVVVGGADADQQPLADGYKYDPIGDTWTATAPLPAARFWSSASEGYVIGGASSFTEEHAEAWYYDYFGDGWSQRPSFTGGPRRGGTGQWVTFFGLSGLYYGLGLHDDQRYKDWWRLDSPTGIDQQDRQGISFHPNPAHHTLQVTWPRSWPEARVQLVDALGRTVLDRQVNSGSPIDVRPLSAGRYLVIAHHGPEQLHGILIKLP